MTTRYTSFAEFYPFYLTQHADRMCRRAHFLGSSSAIAAIAQYHRQHEPVVDPGRAGNRLWRRLDRPLHL